MSLDVPLKISVERKGLPTSSFRTQISFLVFPGDVLATSG